MRERCLQSLAILLAGLFSAERFRPKGLLAPAAEQEPTNAAAVHAKLVDN
ncbi:MAG: hypothetical protein WDO69_06015 [Pseudomonadota bacterium]